MEEEETGGDGRRSRGENVEAKVKIPLCTFMNILFFFFGSFFRSWGPNPGPCAS